MNELNISDEEIETYLDNFFEEHPNSNRINLAHLMNLIELDKCISDFISLKKRINDYINNSSQYKIVNTKHSGLGLLKGKQYYVS